MYELAHCSNRHSILVHSIIWQEGVEVTCGSVRVPLRGLKANAEKHSDNGMNETHLAGRTLSAGTDS